MRKYLVSFLFFSVWLFLLWEWKTDNFSFFSSGLGFIAVLCIPFLLFALVAAGMGKVMKRGTNEAEVARSQKPFLGLQLLFSAVYLLFLTVMLNLSPLAAPKQTEKTDCSVQNRELLTGHLFPDQVPDSDHLDSVRTRTCTAYESLIRTLKDVGKRPTDTQVCLTGVFYTPADTMIGKEQMKAKVMFEFNIPERKGKFYRYLCYCNDSTGFTVAQDPVAVLNQVNCQAAGSVSPAWLSVL